MNELGRFSPAEAILNRAALDTPELTGVLVNAFQCAIEDGGKDGVDRFDLEQAAIQVRQRFGEEQADKLKNNNAALQALGALLRYLYETQKTDLSHINYLDYYEQSVYMELDLTARWNLELTATLRSKDRRGSLIWVLDKTKTPMGARLLRNRLEKPLLSVLAIRRRHGAVASMVENTIAREELIKNLTGFGDMERVMGRIVYGTAGGRELLALRSGMDRLPDIKSRLYEFQDKSIRRLADDLDILDDLRVKIEKSIADDAPVSIREGNIIKKGYHPEVDRLRHILKHGKGVIAELEAREKEKTGIRNLKVGYNKVHGYYIEISNSFKNQVPENYIRRQTLVNAERYITDELKNLEEEILNASDKIAELEYNLFCEIRNEIVNASSRIAQTANIIAQADAFASLAFVAVRNRYCRPEVDESGSIDIHDGRHPVVEQMLKDSLFVPNDIFMGEKEKRVAIITGPNMAGKSTYMRQVALIVLMAQIGSFVPASSARIGVVDRIFTRVGASDDLSAGQSTFMVEMNEVANILKSATSRSLLILDEIGRGTSTFDGMSIARAVLEYCANQIRAKTLFATHYHELTELENTLPGAVNYSVAVKTKGEDIQFIRKIINGGADRSYGIEVAKLAGLPSRVLKRARMILKELEADGINTVTPVKSRTKNRGADLDSNPENGQVSLISVGESEVIDALRRCQPDTMTPMEAMSFLYELKKKI